MATIDYERIESNERTAVWVAPTGTATGVTDVHEPLADEINNTGGASGAVSVAEAISFNDWSFGIEASESTNEPSLADSSSYEEFGQANFGGSFSPYYPADYDDPSNPISVLYDLVDVPGSRQDIITRIDGDISESASASDGDFVSVYRVQRESEQNPFTAGESKRYVAGFIPKSDFAHLVTVGDQTVTAIEPASYAAGSRGRIRASQNGRDTTNRLRFRSDDPDVIEVYPGGFFEITGSASDTATVTIEDPNTGDNDVVAVTVS